MSKKIPSAVIQQLALERVEEERAFIRNLTGVMRANWLRWYEITRLFRARNLSTQNRVFLPLGWEQVEKIAPRLTANNPKYDLIPTKNSAIPFTELVSEWLMFMWEENNLRRQARLMVKSGLIYGSGFVKLDMQQVTKKETVERVDIGVEEVETVDPLTGLPVMEEVEMEEVVEEEIELSNLPVFRTVDIFDIDIDPRVESIEDARALIHTIEAVSLRDLEVEAEDLNYFNLSKVRKLAGPIPGPEGTDKGEKLTTRGIPNQPGSSGAGEEEGVDLNALVVREYWGRFSPKDDAGEEEEYVITTVNDSVVIRLDRNPYATDDNPDGIRPFDLFVDHDVPNELYGVGEIEPTETLQIGLNKIRNQRLDNVDLVMNRMWLFDRTSGINPRDLRSTPGNIIPTDAMDGLQPLSTPDVTASSFAEEDRYIRDFQMATGTIDGTGGGGRDDFTNTATGQKIRSREQNSRYQLKIENLEDTLSRIGQKMLKMIHALDDESFVIRRRRDDGGFKFTEIQRDALDKAIEGMNVKVKATSTVSDDILDRQNGASTRWNLAQSAFNLGILDKDQMAEIFEDLERIAFRQETKVKKPGGGLQGLMPGLAGGIPPSLPGQQGSPTQINPNTGVPNGLAPGTALAPQIPL